MHKCREFFAEVVFLKIPRTFDDESLDAVNDDDVHLAKSPSRGIQIGVGISWKLGWND